MCFIVIQETTHYLTKLANSLTYQSQSKVKTFDTYVNC